jgi:transposase
MGVLNEFVSFELSSILSEVKRDLEKFVEDWNNADSIEDIAKKYDVSRMHASAIAQQARDKGFELKKFSRGRKKGSRNIQRDVQSTNLPTKEEFLKLWNDTRSIAALSRRYELQPHEVKQLLIGLKKSGEEVMPPTRGRPKKFEIDRNVFLKMWNASQTIDDVVEKLEAAGFDFPQEKLKAYATSLAHKLNVERRAKGLADIKKLEKSMSHKKLTFAQVPDIEQTDDENPWDDITAVDVEPKQWEETSEEEAGEEEQEEFDYDENPFKHLS